MARGAKKEIALTPEEKLAQALVPEAEQPYRLPENWRWCKAGAICDFERGITFPASAKEFEPSETNIPCLRTANIQDELEIDDLIYVDKSYMKGNEAKEAHVNDIIMSSANSRELVGKTSYISHLPFPMTFGGFVLTIRVKQIVSKYLFYYLRREFLFGKFMGESTQTTNIANISTAKLEDYVLPLPPLVEQQRIVDRIESLFAKLDEAKEKAQAVVDGFEDRKAAILHKAFTGELTAGWRAEKRIDKGTWKAGILEDYFIITSGIQKKPSRVPDKNPIPYITVANVFRDRIDLTDLRFFEAFEGDLDKYQLEYGDILVVEGNGSGKEIGRCAIWHNELPVCIHQNHIIRVRKKNTNIIPEYVLYYLNGADGNHIMMERAKTTAGLYNLSTGKIKTVPIPVAQLEEQQEIVLILDSLMDKEQRAKSTAEQVIDQIDTMKKAILARAFRGELGTNDPTEEKVEANTITE